MTNDGRRGRPPAIVVRNMGVVMRRLVWVLTVILLVAACGDDDAASTSIGGALFGDDVLEALALRCEAGDFVSCDVLYQASEVGSVYESLGDSCGGRGVPEGAYCVEAYGVAVDLQAARDDCAAGDMLSCDMLYIYSEFGSAEEAFGDSCGSRGDEGLSCAVAHGWTP